MRHKAGLGACSGRGADRAARAKLLPMGAAEAPVAARLHRPCQPILAAVPAGDGWLHELKHDGYRFRL